MKIGTITFHSAINYGAVLQTYALYKVLKNKGQDVKVIDYRPSFNEKRFAPKTLGYFLKPRNIYGILFQNSFQTYKKSDFEKFLQARVEMTSPIYKIEDLKSLNSNFDVFISGSDQVWNLACTEGDETYYLHFVDDPKKRNSYAASIGYTILPKDKQNKYKFLMDGFNHISVRESSGVKIVKDLTGRDIECVLDPTLLLTQEQWSEIADFSIVPDENYLLIYVMYEDKILINYAKQYAKRHSLKIIYINQRFFKLSAVTNICDVSPEQWVGLFMKADTVFTNSYHGLAFSINFERNFYTRYIPRSIANSRIENILDLFKLHHRRIDSDTFNDNTSINYIQVSLVLNQQRRKSNNYLENIIYEFK